MLGIAAGLAAMPWTVSAAGSVAGSVAASVRAATPARIVSLDYGLASTLLSLGLVPQAVVSLADWKKWVIEPEMPAGVRDLGNGWEINFEALTLIRPELIVTTAYLDPLKPRLDQLAPVLRFEIYAAEGGAILPKAYAATRALGAAVGRAAEAEAFLAGADRFFDECRRRLQAIGAPPVALASFLDERHARIYARPGLYDNVIARLGLENAWQGEGNYWGFATIGVEGLAAIRDPRARFFAMEPLPGGLLARLSDSPLWTSLPISRPGRFGVLPGALMFGMVNEAMRFARLLTQALEERA